MNRTSRPVRKQPSGVGVVWLLALVVAVGLAVALAAYQERGPKHTGGVSPEGPAIYVPSPTPAPKPLSLALDLPNLDREQSYWFHQAQNVAIEEQAHGLNQPASTITIWLSLILTESGFRPWQESDTGCCYGLGQLGGALRSEATDADPILNLRVSLREFARLVNTSASLNEAVESYKGVIPATGTKWQADTVWSFLRVGG